MNKKVMVVALLLTGCGTEVEGFRIERGVKQCERHKGLFSLRIYNNEDSTLTTCIDGAKFKKGKEVTLNAT
jgi:hypothetical protein